MPWVARQISDDSDRTPVIGLAQAKHFLDDLLWRAVGGVLRDWVLARQSGVTELL